MEKISYELQTWFFKLFLNEISVTDFEKWLYAAHALENAVGETVYCELIALNFKDRQIKTEVQKIADPFLDYGEFEKRKLKTILLDLIKRNERFPESLIATYHMYCRGYYFLKGLGMGPGLFFNIEFYNYSEWEKLSSQKQQRFIDNLYEEAKQEALIVMEWLDSGKIILTGETNEWGYYKFIDRR